MEIAKPGEDVRMGKVRGSRIAFAAAYVALVVGLFVALGGAAYAQSSATDQYAPKVAGVTVTETVSQPQVIESQALPLTGASLLGVAVVGAGLVALGVALRRRERKTDG
jgi:LPXTG-motif cell wall-anchored protein